MKGGDEKGPTGTLAIDEEKKGAFDATTVVILRWGGKEKKEGGKEREEPTSEENRGGTRAGLGSSMGRERVVKGPGS